MNSPNTRNQRTRLSARSGIKTPTMRRDHGHAPAPSIRIRPTRKKQCRLVHDACDFKTFTNCAAMIFSSPGCNMKEFIDKASPCSAEERTTDGFPLRRAALASRGVRTMWDESHLMCMWGTWLAISGTGKEVVTPGLLVTWLEMKSRRRCHSLFSAS